MAHKIFSFFLSQIRHLRVLEYLTLIYSKFRIFVIHVKKKGGSMCLYFNCKFFKSVKDVKVRLLDFSITY